MLAETELNLKSDAQEQVYRWAYRLLQNHHDALDATQEVAVRALRQPAGELRHARAWLRRVTVNCCVDMRRRPREIERVADAPADEQSPHVAMERDESYRAVLAAVNQLSHQQRCVLMAKVFDEETFAEIAAGMGLAISTVKTHYLRGLQTLREVLKFKHEVQP